MRVREILRCAVALLASLNLAACAVAATTPSSPPAPAPSPSPLPPEVTATEQATAPRPPPTDTLSPPIATSTPTTEPPCVNDAQFVDDLTIPDGKQFLPSQAETKKWSVRNAGTCDWGPDYRLVLVSGEAMGALPELALYPARAGTLAVWEIPLVAPQNPGEYTGRWQARDPEGNLFGQAVFVKIEVIPLPVLDTPPP